MRYIVYGAGAIGSIVGAYLHLASIEVILVARPGHAQQIQRHGLIIKSPSETHHVKIDAVSTANELRPFRGDDVVLLTVKSQHTATALAELEAAGLPSTTPLFCCQNSVVNEHLAAGRFANVYGVVVAMPAVYVTEGEVAAADRAHPGVLDLGRYPDGLDDVACSVASDLRKAGFRVTENGQVMRAKYTKMLANLGNALPAAIGLTPSEGEVNELRAEIRAEAIRVYDRAGIDYEPMDSFNERVIAYLSPCALPEGTQYGGSTWLSLVRKAGSVETDYLNGEIVRLGRSVSVPTPLNLAICQLLAEMTQLGQLPGAYDISDVRHLAMVPETETASPTNPAEYRAGLQANGFPTNNGIRLIASQTPGDPDHDEDDPTSRDQ